MFSLRSTIFILCCLVIPFCLKTIGLEPFPAIEFPAGGIVVKEVNDEVKFDYTVVYGLNDEDKWVEIDLASFFRPIPVHYSSFVIVSNFGKDKAALRANTRRYKILKKLPFFRKYYQQLLNGNVEAASAEYLLERTEWLDRKLADQSLKMSSIKVVGYTKGISTKNGNTISNIKKYEKIIDLDR